MEDIAAAVQFTPRERDPERIAEQSVDIPLCLLQWNLVSIEEVLLTVSRFKIVWRSCTRLTVGRSRSASFEAQGLEFAGELGEFHVCAVLRAVRGLTENRFPCHSSDLPLLGVGGFSLSSVTLDK